MNRYAPLLGLVLLLSVAISGQSQQSDWKVIHSDEFHFIASFPDQPKQTAGDIEMNFGKGAAKRWTLELPDIVYGVVVAEFPNLSVAMEDRALMAFYKSTCAEIGLGNGCRGYYSDELFGVLGIAGVFRNSVKLGRFAMYLVKTRLYLAKVITRESKYKEAHNDMKKFMDEFLFFHTEENEKGFKWGLPKYESQDRKTDN